MASSAEVVYMQSPAKLLICRLQLAQAVHDKSTGIRARPGVRPTDSGRAMTAPGDQRKRRLDDFIHHQGGHDARPGPEDRKSTRLNSSHVASSYAVFCLKKKTSS